jgi:hypothetical protein
LIPSLDQKILRRLALYLAPVALLLVLALLVHNHGRIPYTTPIWIQNGDQARYLAMATHPFSMDALVREPPFCWRILVPLVVSILPLPAPTGFWILTVLSLAVATLALEWFLLGLGLPPAAAAAGGFAFVLLGPAAGFTLWDFMLVDPESFALLALALALAVHRRGLLLLVTLLIFAATKETAFIGAIFGVIWAFEKRDWTLLRWAAGGLVGVIAIIFLIRLALPANASYGYLTEMQRIHATYTPTWSAFEQQTILSGTIDAWNILLPLAILQLIHRPRVWRSPAFVSVLVVVYAQLIIAANTQRLVAYAFPVMIAAAAFEIEYLAGRLQVSRWLLWLPALTLEFVWWAFRARFHTAGVVFDAATADLADTATEQVLLVGVTVLTILVIAALIFERVRRRRPASTELAAQTTDASDIEADIVTPLDIDRAPAFQAILKAARQDAQGRAFLASVYESEGKPYGATDEGLARWLGGTQASQRESAPVMSELSEI